MYDDDHYASLNPQPFSVIGGWAETARWPARFVHLLGEVVSAIARAWRKGNVVRDLRKAASILNFIADQIEIEAEEAADMIGTDNGRPLSVSGTEARASSE